MEFEDVKKAEEPLHLTADESGKNAEEAEELTSGERELTVAQLARQNKIEEVDRENERHALKAVLESLDGHDQEIQARILKAAAVFYGLELS